LFALGSKIAANFLTLIECAHIDTSVEVRHVAFDAALARFLGRSSPRDAVSTRAALRLASEIRDPAAETKDLGGGVPTPPGMQFVK
jgi:hypothetical protein